MNKEYTQKISALMKDLGVPASQLGYEYIRYGIELASMDKSFLRGLTKRLYPRVATQFSTTPTRVERAMRHAVETAFARGDYDKQNEVFGSSFSDKLGRPTVGEFLATIVDYLDLYQ